MLIPKNKNKNYTIVDNYFINDINLKPAGKGMFYLC